MITKYSIFIKESIDDKSEIIFLVGFPAVGKSTWIEKNTNKDYVIINSDNIKEEVAKENNLEYQDMFNEESEFIKSLNLEASNRLSERYLKAIENNDNIIIDMTNLSKKNRKGFLKKIKNNQNYKKIAIIFKPDDIDFLKKVADKRNKELKKKKDISKEVYNDMKKSYIEPTKEEGFDEIIYFDNTKNLKKYLNDN
jgi:predicted kinase